MKRESVVRKNLDLLDEFMKYAFDHPEILDTIPRDRTLVILPEGDQALERQNRKTLRHLKAIGEKAVTMRLKATKRKVSKVG
jgi:predicted ATP-grasp superfamily ATP-dependent carboligase